MFCPAYSASKSSPVLLKTSKAAASSRSFKPTAGVKLSKSITALSEAPKGEAEEGKAPMEVKRVSVTERPQKGQEVEGDALLEVKRKVPKKVPVMERPPKGQEEEEEVRKVGKKKVPSTEEPPKPSCSSSVKADQIRSQELNRNSGKMHVLVID